MTKVTIPSEKWVEAQKSGTLESTFDSAMQRLRPEATYFFQEEGKNECIFVFYLDVPSMLKPLFPNLGASFEVRAVTNGAEFQQQFGGPEATRRTVTPDLLADIRPVAPAQGPKWVATSVESEHSPSDPTEKITKSKEPNAGSPVDPR